MAGRRLLHRGSGCRRNVPPRRLWVVQHCRPSPRALTADAGLPSPSPLSAARWPRPRCGAGRVLAEDLRAAAAPPVEEAPPPAEVAAPAGSAAPRPAPSVPLALPGEEEGPAEERLPLRGLRRRIAENMVL